MPDPKLESDRDFTADETLATVTEDTTDRERLAEIAHLLTPCPPPDVATYGENLCECGYGGTWPCPTTRAAWIAQGLDPAAEARRSPPANGSLDGEPGWDGPRDPTGIDCWEAANGADG